MDLLADHADEPVMMGRLAEVERRNLRLYGYGVKGFTLSMLETAMELCDGAAPPHIIREVLSYSVEMDVPAQIYLDETVISEKTSLSCTSLSRKTHITPKNGIINPSG